MTTSMRLANDRLQIELTEDGGLSVVDSANGKRWSNEGAPFVLHAWNRMMDRPVVTDVCTVVATSTEAGASLALHWPSVQIRLELELTLLPDQTLQVRLRPSSIREENQPHLRLMGVTLWPGFGMAAPGDPGYLLLPFASGVCCDFAADKTEPLTVRRRLYMDQGEWEAWTSLPLFGMQHAEDAGYLCILEQGEWDADVVASLNSGPAKRHGVHAHWHLRDSKADAFDPIDRVFRYVFLAGDEAGYAGMARAYRSYLLNERGASLLRDRASSQPGLAEEAISHTCKIFMASKSRHPDGKGPYDVFTTFDQAIEVMEAFRACGLERVSYQLVGWNIDGHDGQFPRRFPIDPRVGGMAGFRRFCQAASLAGHRVGLHDNYVDMAEPSRDWAASLAAVDREGELVIGGVWSGGQTVYICGSQALKLASRDMPKISELGLDGIYYLDAMPRVSRACHAKGHGHPPGRRADGEGVVELLRYARQAVGRPVGCENAMGFTIPYQDYAGHLVTQSKGLPAEFTDEWVPFFQIAVHGLIKYHLGDPRNAGGPDQAPRQILQEIEYGAMPRFEYQYEDKRLDDPLQFHFGDWRPWLPVLVTQHRILCQDLGHLQTQLIQDHQRLPNGLSVTTYEDGTQLYVDHLGQRYRLNHDEWNHVALTDVELHPAEAVV